MRHGDEIEVDEDETLRFPVDDRELAERTDEAHRLRTHGRPVGRVHQRRGQRSEAPAHRIPPGQIARAERVVAISRGLPAPRPHDEREHRVSHRQRTVAVERRRTGGRALTAALRPSRPGDVENASVHERIARVAGKNALTRRVRSPHDAVEQAHAASDRHPLAAGSHFERGLTMEAARGEAREGRRCSDWPERRRDWSFARQRRRPFVTFLLLEKGHFC